MIRPGGKPKPTGFLPVVNLPDPARNMFKAAAKECLPGGRADGLPDCDFDQQDLEKGEDLEQWEHGVDKDTAREISKDHLVDDPEFYEKCATAREHIPGGKAAGVPDSNFDQHELELGIEHESSEHGPDERIAKEVAKDHLMKESQYYSKKTRKGVDPEISNQDKSQTIVDPAESIESKLSGPPYVNRTTKDFDKSREDFDYDYTGKKPGYLSMDLPKEEQLTKSARTMEDLMDIGVIFPKDFNPEWEDGGYTIGPSTKHRNERRVHDMGLDPFPGKMPVQADDVMQKSAQPLIPNMKLAIAIEPNAQPGARITLLSPLFDDVSPAIQALRSQRFEQYHAIVVDGPPLWLASLEPILDTMDRNNIHETPQALMQDIIDLASTKGLTIDYTQGI
jgi:hypothetical protein